MYCSIITPGFSIPNVDRGALPQLCADNLGTSNIEVFALVPLASAPDCQHLAIQVRGSSFSLSAVEDLLTQREQLTQQLQRSRDALSSCTEQLQKAKEVKIDQDPSKKLHKLEEDNKKLRHLLKSQLENAENLRLATQKTVENLREEFDMLVKEMMVAKEGKNKQEEGKAPDKKPVIPKLKF